MCLGIPGQVVELVPGYEGQVALVDVEGAARRVNVGMLDTPPEPGAWVLIHMGFAVELIDRDRARTAMEGLELIGRGRDSAARARRRYDVTGVVQGVGFRPFVYATATALALTGRVSNTAAGVTVEVEGAPDALDTFGRRLRTDAPPLAVVEEIAESTVDVVGGTGFTIDSSGPAGRARTLASPDVATCADCRAELRDPADRRYRHPFITCTNCGPRFTIITALPYDRATTTMSGFPMCPACRAEYENPADRRFHAQPIACHDCGPRLQLVTGDAGRHAWPPVHGELALRTARDLLARGQILAVKGLGGYHLACDARNELAVATLRARKRRGGKPFAVMAADLTVARRIASLGPDEEALLAGAQRPIVLAPKREPLAGGVAPGNPDLGVLLPYTPLHELLFGLDGDPQTTDVLVMTSGNVSGEPIVTDDSDALRRLAGIADAWLRHDRPIQVPCDDSVSRTVGGVALPVRRARGYAPLPVALPVEVPPMLAAGADLKNAVAVAEGRYAWLSPHIGDMDDLRTGSALSDVARHLQDLTGVRPERLVVDAHPGYRSTKWALDHADGRPVLSAQHHHAHIASVMGEHGLAPGEQVIGIAFDGTGYGTDGAVWGGEVLVCDYKSADRFAHLGYVPLAGGDASVRRPYRMALAHLRHAGIGWVDDIPAVAACPQAERDVLAHQLDTSFGSVPTSSMGRLFDAVASLVGVRHTADYEAEAAIVLEGLARSCGRAPRRAYPMDVDGSVVSPAELVRAVVADVRAGVPAAEIAAVFHVTIATLIADLAGLARDRTGLATVALGGGVFQNAVLLDAAERLLADRGFTVLRPRLLPPNDGGIALGQLLISAAS
ncbi:hydrogenase maturation protein HypF [Asanoa ferruginea]|uniref:Carbamoyltransferase n=1 Tax=Asanoa ferruginea TaxID=53367 RepID=A0A3E0A4T0_9ACTN|nr:carbamoyltransferase HypF [Asanoa ferruginea]REG01381.1 hydrogenase maturation protein HypF [Asanoa ferruginea]GIF47994.1 carbamoyltransferase [Asanoa ferruginea]